MADLPDIDTANGSRNLDRGFWSKMADQWLEDLPKKVAMPTGVRWAIASSGVATYLIGLALFQSGVIRFADVWEVILYFILFILISGYLGFILAYKRTRTGPVRLFLSGVALPSFVQLVIKSTALI
ncbi:MAG: hypothetical protein OXH76_22510 [Boseongicola sp.]|nr:hypothetical protein [Boseongicola sp.]